VPFGTRTALGHLDGRRPWRTCLERALAKIALDPEPLEVANRATQHLYFENPMKGVSDRRSNLFSTHPPVLERINRLRRLSGQPAVDEAVQVLDPAAAATQHAPSPAYGAPTG